MASEYSERGRADGLRWIGLGLAVGAAALAIRRFGGRRARNGDEAESSPPVSMAFTVHRAPDEVARLWTEIDPLRDIVEHVRFDAAPGDRGTELHVRFRPRWFGRRSPAQVQERLRQFKQLAETGEIARSGLGRGVREFGDMPEGALLEALVVGGAR